jgi:hypothetical protein
MSGDPWLDVPTLEAIAAGNLGMAWTTQEFLALCGVHDPSPLWRADYVEVE